jgi:hypothetical protein
MGESEAGATPPQLSDDPRTLTGWLKRIPAVYGLIGAALAAVLGLLAPDRIIPEPLHILKPIISVYVAATFFLAWAWRASLKRRLKLFATGTFVLVMVFALANVVFVTPVDYSLEGKTVERHFVTGLSPVRPELQGLSAADLIKTVGDSLDDFITIWGRGYLAIAIGYALAYLLLILGVVLSVAASDLVQPRKKRASS